MKLAAVAWTSTTQDIHKGRSETKVYCPPTHPFILLYVRCELSCPALYSCSCFRLINFIQLLSQLSVNSINPLNPELNPICYLLALLRAHHFLHVCRIRVKLLTLRRLMSYIYGSPILDVSRSHTTTQHSR